MDGFEKQKILQNFVRLKKYLNLNDQYQKLSVEKKMFSGRMLDNNMENDSPILDCCMRLLSCKPNTYTQFIDY